MLLHLTARDVTAGMSTHTMNYVDLHKVLFNNCVETPKFLRDSDFGHFTLNTFVEPPAWIQSSSRSSDYGVYKDIPLALNRRPGDDLTLLCPFNDHIGTSIWIWQQTWDVNQQFAVRIAKPSRHGDRLTYSHHESAYFAIRSKRAGTLEKDLLGIKSKLFGREYFETAADVFLNLLEQLTDRQTKMS